MKIQHGDLKQISYGEFGVLLEKITHSISEYFNDRDQKIDLIVPILRSGMITALHISSKLKITNLMPAQYKFVYSPKEKLVKKFEFPRLHFEIPQNGNILIVDSNTVFGGTAKSVISDTKKNFPQAHIFFASANLDQSLVGFEGIEQVFFGQLSNERRLISAEEASARNVDNRVIIFPWEDLEEQWSEISASQDQAE